MSELLKKIRNDLKIAMKREIYTIKNSRDSSVLGELRSIKDAARAIISMFPEIGVKPDNATDEDVLKILKRYVTIEKTRELYSQKILTEKDVKGLSQKQLNSLVGDEIAEMGDKLTSVKINFAQYYLPKEVHPEEIEEWINTNIDFSKFKNKMQAMGMIMKHFKGVDGNVVKKILMDI